MTTPNSPSLVSFEEDVEEGSGQGQGQGQKVSHPNRGAKQSWGQGASSASGTQSGTGSSTVAMDRDRGGPTPTYSLGFVHASSETSMGDEVVHRSPTGGSGRQRISTGSSSAQNPLHILSFTPDEPRSHTREMAAIPKSRVQADPRANPSTGTSTTWGTANSGATSGDPLGGSVGSPAGKRKVNPGRKGFLRGAEEDAMVDYSAHKKVKDSLASIVNLLRGLSVGNLPRGARLGAVTAVFLETEVLYERLYNWAFSPSSVIRGLRLNVAQLQIISTQLGVDLDAFFTLHIDGRTSSASSVTASDEATFLVCEALRSAQALSSEVDRLDAHLRHNCRNQLNAGLTRRLTAAYGLSTLEHGPFVVFHLVLLHLAAIAAPVIEYLYASACWTPSSFAFSAALVVPYDLSLALARFDFYTDLHLHAIPLMFSFWLPFTMTLLFTANVALMQLLWFVALLPLMYSLRIYELSHELVGVFFTLLHGAVIAAAVSQNSGNECELCGAFQGVFAVALFCHSISLNRYSAPSDTPLARRTEGSPLGSAGRTLLRQLELGVARQTVAAAQEPGATEDTKPHKVHFHDGSVGAGGEEELVSAGSEFASVSQNCGAIGVGVDAGGGGAGSDSGSQLMPNFAQSPGTGTYWLVLRPSLEGNKMLVAGCCAPFAGLFGKAPSELLNVDLDSILSNAQQDPLAVYHGTSLHRAPTRHRAIFVLSKKRNGGSEEYSLIEFAHHDIAVRTQHNIVVTLGLPKMLSDPALAPASGSVVAFSSSGSSGRMGSAGGVVSNSSGGVRTGPTEGLLAGVTSVLSDSDTLGANISAMIIDQTYGDMVLKELWRYGVPVVSKPLWKQKPFRCPWYTAVFLSAEIATGFSEYIRYYFPNAFIVVLVGRKGAGTSNVSSNAGATTGGSNRGMPATGGPRRPPPSTTTTATASSVDTHSSGSSSASAERMLDIGLIDAIIAYDALRSRLVTLLDVMTERSERENPNQIPRQVDIYNVREVAGIGSESRVDVVQEVLKGDPLLRGGSSLLRPAVYARKLIKYPGNDGSRSGIPAVERQQELLGPFLKRLNFLHPHVVRHFAYRFEREGIALFMEYCHNGTLRDHLLEGAAFPAAEAAVITKEIIVGLQHLHRQGGYHGDLKADNILLGPAKEVKLTDYCSEQQAPAFRAPETLCPDDRIRQLATRENSDVWALGCVQLQMMWGRRYVPFEHLRHNELLSVLSRVGYGLKKMDVKFPPHSKITAQWRTFTWMCLSVPIERPSLDQLLAHEFLANTSREELPQRLLNSSLNMGHAQGSGVDAHSAAPTASSLGDLSMCEPVHVVERATVDSTGLFAPPSATAANWGRNSTGFAEM